MPHTQICLLFFLHLQELRRRLDTMTKEACYYIAKTDSLRHIATQLNILANNIIILLYPHSKGEGCTVLLLPMFLCVHNNFFHPSFLSNYSSLQLDILTHFWEKRDSNFLFTKDFVFALYF